jgi:Ca-activated chloride channel family protein
MKAGVRGRVHLIRGATGAFVLLLGASLAQEPVFRAEVKLVRVLATVRNLAGELVGSLSKEDFRVFDNGVEQEIAVFERQTVQPLSVMLLIDTSLSTAKDLRYETEAVSRFARAVFAEGNPEDAVALISFSYEVRLLANFTRRLDRIEREMRTLKPASGTSLYDAIYLASRELADREGRRVLIVVTDGGDTTSSRRYHDALEAIQRADAVMYAILVMPITNEAGRNVGGENALAGLAAGSAGRVFRPESMGAAVDEAFRDILRELRTQYLLAFYPKGAPPGPGGFHRLEVRLRNPDLRVNARSGYYEGVSAGSAPGSGGWRSAPPKPR